MNSHLEYEMAKHRIADLARSAEMTRRTPRMLGPKRLVRALFQASDPE
jgi:hypothetical protein